MEREDVIVLDSGIDMENMDGVPKCCEAESAAVR